MRNYRYDGKNYYDITYEILLLIIERMECYNIDDREKVIKSLFDFVRSNSKYDKDLENFMEEFGVENKDYIKRIMMLIMASKSFIMNNYDANHDINESISLECLQEINGYSATMVIEEFFSNSEKAYNWVEDYYDYTNRNYIFQNMSMELSIKNGILKEILKINPLEMFDFNEIIPSSAMLPSEIRIQEFFDLYDKTLCYITNDDNGELENYENPNEFIHAMFIENLKEYFNYEIKEIEEFIKYLFGNVYEWLTITKLSQDDYTKKYIKLIKMIEENNIKTLVEKFLNDYNYAIFLIDAFIDCNSQLIADELYDLRRQFKKYGNIRVLKRINPYYYAEEVAYAKMNKNEASQED